VSSQESCPSPTERGAEPMRAVLPWILLALMCAPTAGQGFVVSGRFEYEDKSWDVDGWTGEDPMVPIRHADVTVLDVSRNKVLGRSTTDASGAYAVLCSAAQVVDLQVRVDAESRGRSAADKSFPRIVVRTPTKQRYSAWSPIIPSYLPSQDLDLGITSVLKLTVNGREGNPFAIFDMAVAAFEYVTSPEVGMSKRVRRVELRWPNPTGSFSIGRRAWISTGDGYDDAVVLHEVGHIVHNIYSDSDNPGGLHFFGDSDQDLRLAFAEGWATAFAGTVLGRIGQPALYLDANGSAQTGGVQLRLDLETAEPYQLGAEGAGDEIAVACVIYDLLDDASSGDNQPDADDDFMAEGVEIDGLSPAAAWWSLFTGPLRRARKQNMNHVWDSWLMDFAEPEFAALQQVFEERHLRFWNDSFEPDDSPQAAQTIEPSTAEEWGPDRTLYSASVAKPGPGTGDQDWYAVPLIAGQQIEIETRYPDGTLDAATQADPFLALYAPSGKRVARDDDSGYRRNALLTDILVSETGVWRFVVRTRNRLNRYGRYNVRVTLLDE
jgi:hypothetical protein